MRKKLTPRVQCPLSRETGTWGRKRTYARSQRFAEKRRWIARSSRSDFCERYESIILPVASVRSAPCTESGAGWSGSEMAATGEAAESVSGPCTSVECFSKIPAWTSGPAMVLSPLTKGSHHRASTRQAHAPEDRIAPLLSML